MVCAPLDSGGWLLEVWEVLTKRCLENGYGDLGMSDKPCGGGEW